jgi:hypothetical protein
MLIGAAEGVGGVARGAVLSVTAKRGRFAGPTMAWTRPFVRAPAQPYYRTPQPLWLSPFEFTFRAAYTFFRRGGGRHAI